MSVVFIILLPLLATGQLSWTGSLQSQFCKGVCANTNSLVLQSGVPAISWAFTTPQPDQLLFSVASDASGAVWRPPVVIATGFGTSLYDMSLVNGAPAVAVRNGVNVVYKRATAADGNTWPASTVTVGTLSGPTQPLHLISSANAPGPAICTRDAANVVFYSSPDQDGASWIRTNIATAISVGVNTDVVCGFDTQGFPFVFYTETGDQPYFIRASNTAGTSWNARTPIFTSGQPGYRRMSAAVVNSRPAVSGTLISGPSVRYFYPTAYDQATGNTTWPAAPVIFSQGAADYSTLNELRGAPAIAWSEEMDTGLVLRAAPAGCANAVACPGGFTPRIIVDSRLVVYRNVRAHIIGGTTPFVTWYRDVNPQMNYIWASINGTTAAGVIQTSTPTTASPTLPGQTPQPTLAPTTRVPSTAPTSVSGTAQPSTAQPTSTTAPPTSNAEPLFAGCLAACLINLFVL